MFTTGTRTGGISAATPIRKSLKKKQLDMQFQIAEGQTPFRVHRADIK